MAVYEFKCLKCKNSFEIRQPMGSEHIADCPVCKGSKTQRVFSTPGMIVRSPAYMMAKNNAPKSRLENMDKVREERAVRKTNAKTEREALDNSFHPNKKNKDKR